METRKCVLTLEGGYKITAEVVIPKSSKPVFHDELEKQLVREFNKSQPYAVHKVVKMHILRK
jgi:uncharacterized protein YktA (UPF0223 family)